MVATADLQSLHKLNDPSEWEVISDCPVFDEHDELGPDGQVLRRFDRAMLQRLADNCKRRERTTGTRSPVTLGHTVDNAPESAQPKHVGYARAFRVGTFGPKAKLGILCDFYIRKKHFEELKTYPRPPWALEGRLVFRSD